MLPGGRRAAGAGAARSRAADGRPAHRPFRAGARRFDAAETDSMKRLSVSRPPFRDRALPFTSRGPAGSAAPPRPRRRQHHAGATGGRWWIVSVATEIEQPGRPIPEAHASRQLARCGRRRHEELPKIDFSLEDLDDNGASDRSTARSRSATTLRPQGPEAGRRVRSIDPRSRSTPTAQPHRLSRCCASSTHQRGFREVLEKLYVERAPHRRTWFERRAFRSPVDGGCALVGRTYPPTRDRRM
jgi:hypothetical protein